FLFFIIGHLAQAATCQQLVGKVMCYKIGQMLIVGFGGFAQTANGQIVYNDPWGTQFNSHSLLARDIAKAHVGGVIFFSEPWRDVMTQRYIRDRNITSPEQLTQLVNPILSFYQQQMIK